jgi:hypothetical protein
VGVEQADARTAGACSPIVIGVGGNVTINNNCPIGLTEQDLERVRDAVRGGLAADFTGQIGELSARLGVTRTAIETFLRLLGERQVPIEDLDARLRELAARYLRFSQVLAAVGSSDPGIQSLRVALERGDVDGVAGAIRGLEERLAAEAGQAAAERVAARAAIRTFADQVRRRGIRAGGVLVADKRWPTGDTVRFCFVDGKDKQRRRVVEVAREWSLYANLNFDFGLLDHPRDCSTQEAENEMLRITLVGEGSWAYIGTSASGAPRGEPQVSIPFRGWEHEADSPELSRIILHEFGHVLGFEHAFTNPKAHCADQVDWDRAAEWARRLGFNVGALQNLFPTRDAGSVVAGDVDPESVMTYALPSEIFRTGANPDCVHTPGPGLSLGDKLAAFEAYP